MALFIWFPTYFSKSFTYTIPTILSKSSWYTGTREYPPFNDSWTISERVAVSSTATTSVLWVAISEAVVSLNSNILVISSFSFSKIAPVSSPLSTMVRIPSSVIPFLFASGATPKIRLICATTVYKIHVIGNRRIQTPL